MAESSNSLLPEISIALVLEQLRRFCRQDCQHHWHCLPSAPWEIVDWRSYPLGKVNEKGYLVWEKGEKVQWFAQTFTVSKALADYPLDGLTLRLALTWWAQNAQIFVNGKLVQAGDLFDSKARILLTDNSQIGETFTVALQLTSPSHDIGGLMQSQLIFERQYPALDPGFIADEIEVLSLYLTQFEPEKVAIVSQVLEQILWEQVTDQSAFDQSLMVLRQKLLPLTEGLKQQQMNLLGHAHLDMAWLWPLEETWEVGERTFRSVINLQREFPDLVFGHTSPVLYEWLEANRPELFKQIQTAVAKGNWELLGGMWVEPEVNIISGESLARQLLYGQRYFQRKFGLISKVGWLPDSFGFSGQLPQIFRQGGIDYFVTGKLHWNDTNPFPHGAFHWRSPDGTELFTVMAPPNLAGVMDNQPLPMANYANRWQQQTELKECLWLPGVGDHGGGPSRDMWLMKERWQNSEFFPTINTAKAEDFLASIKQALQPDQSFPVWEKELYLELHRGCFTVHADQKFYNRQCEHLLYEAELWSSFASWLGNYEYPQIQLESAWKKVLLNQFHDILPGTSIPEVFVTANQAWQEVYQTSHEIINQSLASLSSQVKYPCNPTDENIPLLIFNPLHWPQNQLVEIPVQPGKKYQVYDWQNERLVDSQLTASDTLLFVVNSPPLTCIGYWLQCEEIPSDNQQSQVFNQEIILDNGCLKVKISPESGEIISIDDLVNHRQVLAGHGNQLQFFRDQGQYWDAWNIDPDYEQYSLPSAQLINHQWLEQGPLRWRLRVTRKFQQSVFIQDYCLTKDSPLLEIKTVVDWQETHVMVKAAFPVALQSEFFTTEAPCAVVDRPIKPQTEMEKAQWEVPHQHWFSLTDQTENYGVSLLNNCKYGCDVKENLMRLTLLRSSVWPDANADRGKHQFSYYFYPHPGDWRSAKTVAMGYGIHRLLRPYFPKNLNATSNQSEPWLGKPWLTIGSENLCLMALKRQEDNPKNWIIRCYETMGKSAQLDVTTICDYRVQTKVNLLEEPQPGDNTVNPWQIVSVSLAHD
ncbi:alpha-mannosidase [Synechocystis sp. FACHB-383]|uniref:alpha-mannosidase n=1 Tax=Synechocystis sp. FACHB-383 TaxID=2692864 RepID=UPI001686D08A|nr:alpha-mannosidase [Synechocystis sp. FACHB-383]MBD2652690.1 alpha-mannosidase [Synechocystis sp. FACHB-383]